jgi:hypothetical protein
MGTKGRFIPRWEKGKGVKGQVSSAGVNLVYTVSCTFLSRLTLNFPPLSILTTPASSLGWNSAAGPAGTEADGLECLLFDEVET